MDRQAYPQGNGETKRGSVRLILCLVMFNLCCLPAVAMAHGPRLYPSGSITVPFGQPLDLYCEDDYGTAEDIQFLLGGKAFPSEIINGTTIRLHERLEKGVYAFYCHNSRSKKNSAIRVLVDEAPGNVTDFKCKSYNLEELNCTWTAPKSISLTRYSLSYRINGLVRETCKGKTISDNRRVCSWNAVSIPRYRLLDETFSFTLTSINVFGRNEQNFTVDHYSVVQAAPVSNIKVGDIGPYSVTLNWSIPNNMIDLLPQGVEHKIEYQISKIDNTLYYRSVDTSSLPPRNKIYSLTLHLPYAHTLYKVRISIRPVQAIGEEYWSRPTYITITTEGKSASEINKLIYDNWRKSMKKPGPAFKSKLWMMKGQKQLYEAWKPRKYAPLA